MENPKEKDIERVRYCKKCNSNFNGPACVHCELDEIFQVRSLYNFSLSQVSKSTSDLEIVLTITRNSSRGFLERERISAARKQLDLLEGLAQSKENMKSKYLNVTTVAEAPILSPYRHTKGDAESCPVYQEQLGS